jgi:hypothetical protein
MPAAGQEVLNVMGGLLCDHPLPGGVQCIHGAARVLCGAEHHVPRTRRRAVQRVSLCNRQGNLPEVAHIPNFM